MKPWTCLIPFTTWLLTCPLPAQEPVAPPPEPDAEVAEKIEALADAWKDRRMRRDAEAARLAGELATRLDRPIHDDDRKAILVVLSKVLTTGRLRAPDAIEPYRNAVDGLARLGDDGAKVMMKIFDRKRFPRHTDWAPMREVLIEAIGRTGAPRVIPFLCERVQRSGEDGELRSAGTAMARFTQASEKDRKEMVGLLSRRLGGFEAEAAAPAVNQDNQLNLNRENAARMLRAVRSGWQNALTQLTGENLGSGAEWQKWYQDNKRKRWPERPKDS